VVAAVAEMHWCSEDSSKYFSNPKATTRVTRHIAVFVLVNVLGSLMLPARCGAADTDAAQELSPGNATAQENTAIAAGMGRLYVFRPIRSFGAHIDDYITLNGVPVHRLTPGTGFYCDVPPADYVIGIARHKTNPTKVSVAAGQSRFICVMLHHLGGVAPRSGALTSDQSFDVRLLEPNYGAKRMQGYRMTEANCRPFR
jgi:hypothetical protein